MDELEAMGCANAEATGEEASEDNCKEVIGEKFTFEEKSLEAFYTKFEELLGREASEELESETGTDLLAVAEEGCKFSKTYTIESECKGKFLYLIRDNTKKIRELCVVDLTDEETIK
jgi:hypothetical protein